MDITQLLSAKFLAVSLEPYDGKDPKLAVLAAKDVPPAMTAFTSQEAVDKSIAKTGRTPPALVEIGFPELVHYAVEHGCGLVFNVSLPDMEILDLETLRGIRGSLPAAMRLEDIADVKIGYPKVLPMPLLTFMRQFIAGSDSVTSAIFYDQLYVVGEEIVAVDYVFGLVPSGLLDERHVAKLLQDLNAIAFDGKDEVRNITATVIPPDKFAGYAALMVSVTADGIFEKGVPAGS